MSSPPRVAIHSRNLAVLIDFENLAMGFPKGRKAVFDIQRVLEGLDDEGVGQRSADAPGVEAVHTIEVGEQATHLRLLLGDGAKGGAVVARARGGEREEGPAAGPGGLQPADAAERVLGIGHEHRLQAIPEELYESARVEGASDLSVFWHVTLPLLSPTLFFVSVVGTILAFQSFGQIHILTRGGPLDATTVIVYSIWQDAFQRFDYGVASVQAVALFLLVLGLTVIQIRFLERRVFYQ